MSKLFHSKSGMNTKYWGPRAWDFLFTSILGTYPVKIVTLEDVNTKIVFENLLTNLGYIMPCVYCRNSFKIFIKELPIEPYLSGRIDLMYWLYQIKDKVNKKLFHQEEKCYQEEKKKLKQELYNKMITKKEYNDKLKEFKYNNFKTISTPSFQEVLLKYEKQRAKCDKRAKRCSL